MIRRIPVRLAASLAAAGLLAFFVGCATGGYRSVTTNGHEKVYKIDDAGEKNLVYEVGPDGELTVHDETDARAQQMLEAKARVQRAEAAEAERIDRITAAPKRAPDDPIRVILYQVELDENLRQAQHSEGSVDAQLRQEFAADNLIRLVDPAASQGQELTQVLKALTGQAPGSAPIADVEVVSRATVEEKVGVNRKTKKLGTYAAVVFEARITSNYLPAEYTVTEEGNIFANAEVTRKFAEKIRSVIAEQIGPTIPADREL